MDSQGSPRKQGRTPLIRLLAGTELFKSLTPEDLAACAARFHEVKLDKGEMLFARGDLGTHLYVVAEGQVRLAVATSQGRELSFHVAMPGDLFGEISVFDGWPRTADATALTAVTAYSVERHDFREFWSANPAISVAVVSFLCRRLRDTNDKFEALALYPMEARLARFLLLALGHRESVPGKRLPLDLGYSQGELALLLGASRPKLNAALKALEKAGAVGRTADRLFCDPAKLTCIAQGTDAA